MSEKKRNSNLPVILIAILAKSSKLLKIAKFFKVAKPLVLVISMSISAIAYAFMLGPWLSILFVTLLFLHEMGHVVAMKIKGFDTPTPVFIPFLGAVIFAPRFKDRYTEAFVGYGGPLLGTIASLAIFSIWSLMPKDTSTAHILIVGSYLGTYLNLFNLIPISPLDGGRITQAVGKWFIYIGLTGLAVFSMTFRQPVILYIWILVLMDLTIIPLRLRAVVISTLWVSMVLLMSLGFGDQPFWINVADCIITLVLVGLSVGRAVSNVVVESNDDRMDLPIEQRIKWLVLYFGLSLFLLTMIIVQIKFLPHQL